MEATLDALLYVKDVSAITISVNYNQWNKYRPVFNTFYNKDS